MLRSWASAVFAVALLGTMSGCVVSDLGVSNPLPRVRRIAIAPFINLSTDPDVDLGRNALFAGGFVDRRFALAYFAELQKTPGFEVIPVGVVEQAIASSGLAMNGPEDYLQIANRLGADAIVIGAVTDFDPYHPRLGLQVQWYSNDGSRPPAPTMPYEREWDEQNYIDPDDQQFFSRHRKSHRDKAEPCSCRDGSATDPSCDPCVTRGQSPAEEDQGIVAEAEDDSLEPNIETADSDPGIEETPRIAAQPLAPPAEFLPSATSLTENGDRVPQVPPPLPNGQPLPAPRFEAEQNFESLLAPANSELLPLYSYTRFFDGRDARVTARLRDYVELSGDLRSGGWESYLERSDDFIRFACHVMIQEMLLLHGGESSRRTVFKVRKELFRKL